MKWEKWHLGVLALVVIVITIIVVWNFAPSANNNPESSSGNGNVESQTSSASESQEYFDDNAKVMFFYSDYCSWCKKEEIILKDLAGEGYRVKPMNVGKDTSLSGKYNVTGTPTFIADDGDKLVGYQDKETLKAYLDKHK